MIALWSFMRGRSSWSSASTDGECRQPEAGGNCDDFERVERAAGERVDMKGRTVGVVYIAALAGAVISCSDSSPSQPSGTGSVTAPILVQPPPGASIRNADQPVTLAVENAVVTQASTKTYAFEVATDSNFNTKVQTRS